MDSVGQARASLSLSLRGLAMGAVLVALTCLATLIVVVGVKGVDALSTVAMALAILAFVVQLIVFIVQAAEASRQSAQSRELHAQMMLVLAQLQERTQGTQLSVERMNTRLLEAVIGKAASEGMEVGSPGFAEAVARGLGSSDGRSTNRAGRSPINPPDVQPSEWPGPLPADEAARIHSELSTWPDVDHRDEIGSALGQLSEVGFRDFARLVRDMHTNTRPGAELGPGLSGDKTDEMVKLGLAELVPGWGDLYTLSPKGRQVARILTARGEPPAHWENFTDWREKYQRLLGERLQGRY